MDEKRIDREQPEPEKGRAELVKEWLEKIEKARDDFWAADFEAMKRDAKFVSGRQWDSAGSQAQESRYVANLTLRHINQRVASLYAKNPRVRATMKKRMYSKVWDGSQEMLQMAMSGAMDPEVSMTILTEAAATAQDRSMRRRIAQTAEIVLQYSLDEPIPKFKIQAKALVRRVLTCGVGYLKLGFQRQMGLSADTESAIADMGKKLALIQQMADDLADQEIEADSADAEALRLQLAELQTRKDMLVREGLVFGFPKPWSLIMDPCVTQIKGFVGAGWIAQEYCWEPERVQQLFNVDVGKDATNYEADGGKSDRRYRRKKFVKWYEVYDLRGQQQFSVASGYKEFLREPGAPDLQMEQFHPYFALTYNDIESCDEAILPPSNVTLVRPMQLEYNRQREALRQHRIANRPAYVEIGGIFTEETKEKFETHKDHEVISLNASKNDKIADLLQAKPTVPITPDLYDSEGVFVDFQRTVGDAEAHMGGTSGATATENTIADASRASSVQSNVDDLDDFLTDVLGAAGQVCLKEMSEETVLEIAGPGAAWPQLSRDQIAQELIFEVKAGSSGRPAKGARTQAIERVLPLLVQIPGIKPAKLAEFLLTELDESIELDEFLDDNLPSIVAMNAMSKPNMAPQAGGEGQAAQGASNAESPAQSGAKMQNMDAGAVDGPAQLQ